MLEYSSFILQSTTVILLKATTYIYSLIKMAESIINKLLPGVSRDPPESDVNRHKFIKCIVTGNSKQYLQKDYTEEQVKKLSSEEVNKLFNIYEMKLLGQMVKSLGKSIIKMYSMKTCSILGITNQDVKTWNLTHLQT